jgi:hypothetical protein
MSRKLKMKKVMRIFATILFLSLITTSCGNKSKSSENGSQSTYSHTCSHCSEGFNGGGYVSSAGDVMSVSDSEVESYPAHYCSKSCALSE